MNSHREVAREGRTRVTADERATLESALIADLARILDRELPRRMPSHRHLVVDRSAILTRLFLRGVPANRSSASHGL